MLIMLSQIYIAELPLFDVDERKKQKLNYGANSEVQRHAPIDQVKFDTI
jgi:hypothetical protein